MQQNKEEQAFLDRTTSKSFEGETKAEHQAKYQCEFHLCKEWGVGYEEYRGMIVIFCNKHKEWFDKLSRSERINIILAYNVDAATEPVSPVS